jgi:HD-GYP domain-containing protein (c-di-GMP phosphodiesterase class II)
MAEEYYVPVTVESIEPNMFPDVSLYMKSGNNYVLYKSHDNTFTKQDTERLLQNKVDFLYVSPEDMDTINEYMESNADRLLKSDKFDSKTKGKIIYQTSINYVGDIFTNPEKVTNMSRSTRMIENLLTYLSSDSDALSSLESVMSHNYYTFVHSLQVTTLSIMLHSEAYLLERDELMDVGIGTLLHDFGKVFIPQGILKKQYKLTPDEIELIKKHPEDGYRFLKENTKLNDIALSIVRYHHERNNGTGYPLGLKGEAIPRSAQVGAICDVYCTMTIDHSGRRTIPPSLCVQIMREEMKGSFNERLLGVLEDLVANEG